jgi:ABC-2 type transport system ATP-binding protein
MKNVLLDLKKQGKTIFLSTHQMNEVEELCDRILMINKGSAVLYGNLNEIKSQYRGHSVYLNMEGNPDQINGVEKVQTFKDFIELHLDKETKPQDILTQLVNNGIKVNHFEIATPSLNDIFLKIVSQ